MPETNYIIQTGEQGSVHISEEVIAIIAQEAVREVDGFGAFATTFGGEIAERLGSKRPTHRGVKIHTTENEVSVDIFILVQYGTVIHSVAAAAQEAVASSMEAITGLAVKSVDVTVCGIVFEKEK
ncbi:MAG: Asp23/Gls24 family envelope stress response protein [Oscillospiraceae bacterium]|nr:Asp23/Gls24 family envelope stress response protein [Oscillospiraceae bacterium]